MDIITPEAAYWDSAATLTQASVGQPAYFSDDHTVTLTAGTNTYAGRIKAVDRYGVLVDMRGAYVEPALPVTSCADDRGVTECARYADLSAVALAKADCVAQESF